MLRRTLTALLTASGCAFITSPASAIPTPVLDEVNAYCQFVNQEMHTVRLQMGFGQATPIQAYEVKFVSTGGQVLKFTESAFWNGTKTYPIPTGSYKITISIVQGAIVPNTGQTIYNLVVPPTISTGGKGTGCAFQQ